MTRSERREARIERLFWELRRKYFAASGGRLVCHDIMWDIDGLKKYNGLTAEEKADLCIRAVEATDGYSTAEHFAADQAEEYGSLAGFFRGEAPEQAPAPENDKATAVETHLKTPRGSFRYAFETLEEAKADGWGLWFQHNHEDGADRPYTTIVTKDNCAVAVRERTGGLEPWKRIARAA